MGLIKRFANGGIVRANEVGVRKFAPLTSDELLTFLLHSLAVTLHNNE